MFTVKSKNKKNGFTLVETLVAVSIFTVSILGLLEVVSQGIASTNYAQMKIAATYLAQEGIECLRNTRDNYVLYPDSTHDWSKFLLINPDNVTCPSVDSGFSRDNTLTAIGTDGATISSTVSWIQASGPFSVTFSENVYNWLD